MKSRLLKAIIGILVLVISPLFMVVVVGALYIAFHMITGYSMIEAYHSFAYLIRRLVPYLSCMTSVLIVILSLILLGKLKILVFRENTRH